MNLFFIFSRCQSGGLFNFFSKCVCLFGYSAKNDHVHQMIVNTFIWNGRIVFKKVVGGWCFSKTVRCYLCGFKVVTDNTWTFYALLFKVFSSHSKNVSAHNHLHLIKISKIVHPYTFPSVIPFKLLLNTRPPSHFTEFFSESNGLSLLSDSIQTTEYRYVHISGLTQVWSVFL